LDWGGRLELTPAPPLPFTGSISVCRVKDPGNIVAFTFSSSRTGSTGVQGVGSGASSIPQPCTNNVTDPRYVAPMRRFLNFAVVLQKT